MMKINYEEKTNRDTEGFAKIEHATKCTRGNQNNIESGRRD